MTANHLPKNLLLKNARIIDPVKMKEFEGDILIRNGNIEAVGVDLPEDGGETINVNGKIVTHGFCDIHAHFREPGREDKETLESGSKAALAGGFTTVCVMPNTDPPIDSPESIRFLVEKAENLPVNIHPMGAVTMGQKGEHLTEMASMIQEGAVAFSDDGVPVMNSGVMRRALEYAAPLGVPVINHAEDLTLKGEGQINEGDWSTELGLAGIPDVSESSMVSRDIQVAEFVKGRLHIPHISSRKSVELIRWAKEQGVNVTAEVTPHHLYFTDAHLVNYDTNLKVAPPIRSEKDRLALMTALKDGIIDCMATDHAPHTIEDKEAPFDWAPPGMIGLESAFGAVWKVMSGVGCELIEIVKGFTTKPRTIMGLASDLFQKGTPAELVIFDPDAEWVFQAKHIHSKSRNTPFIGERLKGKVLTVISKGMIFQF